MPLKVNKMFIKKALMPARSKFGFSSFLDAFARDANSNHVRTGADRLRLFGAHEIAICSALASPFDNQVCGSDEVRQPLCLRGLEGCCERYFHQGLRSGK